MTVKTKNRIHKNSLQNLRHFSNANTAEITEIIFYNP